MFVIISHSKNGRKLTFLRFECMIVPFSVFSEDCFKTNIEKDLSSTSCMYCVRNFDFSKVFVLFRAKGVSVGMEQC